VVCNTVGPFAQYGGEVVEACSTAGCHYLDTTGVLRSFGLVMEPTLAVHH
jgi:short subunit dehydrogenase-like uncharacterized protein